MMCSCNQLRKLVAQVWPVGRMSLEPGLLSGMWPDTHLDLSTDLPQATHIITPQEQK